MKKILIFLFIIVSATIFAQEDKYYGEQELDVNSKKKTETNSDFQRFRIGAYVGYSLRTGFISPNISSEERDYMRSLLHGFNLGANATFFIKKFWGIGLEYEFNHFATNKYIPVSDNAGTVLNLTDKITLNQALIMFNFRFKSKKLDNSYLFLAIGLGYINYYDRCHTDFNVHLLSEVGNTICETTRVGYEFGISKRVGFFLQASLNAGILFFTTIKNETTGEQIRVNCLRDYGNTLGLGRLEFSAGIRF